MSCGMGTWKTDVIALVTAVDCAPSNHLRLRSDFSPSSLLVPWAPLGNHLGKLLGNLDSLYAPPRSYTWLTLFAFNSPLSPITTPFLSFCLFNGPCSPTNLTHSAIVALTPRLGLIATQNPLPLLRQRGRPDKSSGFTWFISIDFHTRQLSSSSLLSHWSPSPHWLL